MKNEVFGKVPPQAIDTEEAVLGSLLIEGKSIQDVYEFLNKDDFYLPNNALIYNAISTLYQNGDPIDIRTVISVLRKDGNLEKVGGAYRIAELSSKVSSSATVEYLSRIIKEMSLKRNIIDISNNLLKQSYEDTSDVFELLDNAHSCLDKIDNSLNTSNYKEASKIAEECINELYVKSKLNGVSGVRSGIKRLDSILGGFQNGNLIIIGARPAMGKSATLCSFVNQASKNNVACGVFSLEMTAVELFNRIVSSESNIDASRIHKGAVTSDEITNYISTTKRLSKLPIFIDETPSISIQDFRVRARKMKKDHNIGILFVDYIQIMNGERTYNGNREQEISSISRGLKKVAKELNIPVVALSQLSRTVESRGDKRPMLSDLRESGSIEQDADVVMFLYRPEVYKIMSFSNGTSTTNVMEIIVSKHRHGRLDDIPTEFIANKMTIRDMFSPHDYIKQIKSNIDPF